MHMIFFVCARRFNPKRYLLVIATKRNQQDVKSGCFYTLVLPVCFGFKIICFEIFYFR